MREREKRRTVYECGPALWNRLSDCGPGLSHLEIHEPATAKRSDKANFAVGFTRHYDDLNAFSGSSGVDTDVSGCQGVSEWTKGLTQ